MCRLYLKINDSQLIIPSWSPPSYHIALDAAVPWAPIQYKDIVLPV